jgi:hypothetical protein
MTWFDRLIRTPYGGDPAMLGRCRRVYRLSLREARRCSRGLFRTIGLCSHTCLESRMVIGGFREAEGNQELAKLVVALDSAEGQSLVNATTSTSR